MADASYEVDVSLGLSKAEVCSLELKPTKEFEFVSDGALSEGYGFSTPSTKDLSQTSAGRCFMSPPQKHRLLNGDDIFGSFNTPSPVKKRVTHSFDEQCSTVAPSPACLSMTHTSPWPSPTTSKGLSIEHDLAGFLPSPPRAHQFLPKVPCSMKDIVNIRHDPPAAATCPTTPRTDPSQPAQPAMTTPPTTPRNTSLFSHVGCLSLPSEPRRKPAPPLLQALQVNSIEMVRDAIADNADAAALPFWDHNVEPPLCCAARLSCDAPIVSLLMDAGADVNATNADGNTALDIVRRPARCRGDDVAPSDTIFACTSAIPPKQNKDEVERLLLAAGARPSEATSSEESLPLPWLFYGTDMCLSGDNDDKRQFDTSSAWPTISPWQLDVTEMEATFDGFK
eukprot:TRINITY_DN13924_c0_g1_i2.p1 TRINITY_DN13924_c0_g1~~TRINITY_DN13924_c0_g1_i2.p1  ORF type:complete len:395 (-),score=65.90 TRINITY_DN13924_c0_g1_i2:414-1598(-)